MEASVHARVLGARIRRTVEGVMELTQHRLSDKLVNQDQLYRTLRRLRSQLLEKQLEMALPSLNDVYKLSTSYLAFVGNSTIRGILHIPLMRVGTRIQLYRYIPAPVMMHDGHTILPKPGKHFLAVAEDGSLYKELSQEELSFCHHLGDMYNCDDSGFSLRTRSESCLMALFDRAPATIADSCAFVAHVEVDRIMQLGPNEVLLYQSHVRQSGTVYVSCPGRSDTVEYVGMKRIIVPAGCYLKSRSFFFDGASSLVTSPISLKIQEFPVQDVFSPHFNDSLWITTMMQSLNRVDREDGMKIRDIKAMYANEHSTFTIGIALWVVVAVAFALGGCAICLRIRHFVRRGKEFRARNFFALYPSQDVRRSGVVSEEEESVELRDEARRSPRKRTRIVKYPTLPPTAPSSDLG